MIAIHFIRIVILGLVEVYDIVIIPVTMRIFSLTWATNDRSDRICLPVCVSNHYNAITIIEFHATNRFIAFGRRTSRLTGPRPINIDFRNRAASGSG